LTDEFTVRLEQVFQGPLDLLLHLVREQEVEIHEVEISRVIEGYLTYLRQLQELDIEFAGEFLVMASTLMLIKSRSLFPREEVDIEDELDPRDELIQQLLEYRKFKEAAGDLDELRAERQRIHGRGSHGELDEHGEEEVELDLGELTVWDLLSTFSRLMRETAADRPHRVQTDPRPLRFYVESLVDAIRRRPEASLREIVTGIEGGTQREGLVGSFCALLEMVRMGLVTVEQGARDDDIAIRLRPEHADDLDEVVRSAGFEDEVTGDEPGTDGEARTDDQSGTDGEAGDETERAASGAGAAPAWLEASGPGPEAASSPPLSPPQPDGAPSAPRNGHPSSTPAGGSAD